MGCHTWFRNKIADMPQEHINKLREVHIKRIKNAYIYKCSKECWMNNIKSELDEFRKQYKGQLTKLSAPDKVWYDILKKECSEDFYTKERQKYVDDLETLKNPKATREELLKIFIRHDLSFDKDLKNGSYDLGDVGWHDNYRVYGYPDVTHHNADEAIKFLEEYDDGNNIQCDYIKGMCDEIRDIINNFFKQFPNGTIHYG